EDAVGDAVVDEDLALTRGAGRNLILGDDAVAEFGFRHLVAPVTERPLRELHDVALVHDGDRLALVVDGVLNRHADETLGASLRDGLDADARVGPDPLAHLALDE